MLTLSPSKKAFLSVFALSCVAHIAVFGLPLSRQKVEVAEAGAETDLIDTAPAENAQPIAITTLPPSASAEVSSRELSESAPQAIAPQPAPHSLPAQVLPEEPVPFLVEPSVASIQLPASPSVAVTSPLVSDEPQPTPALDLPPEQLEPEQPESEQPEHEQQSEPEQSDPAMIVSVGDNFPHLAGAQGNCFNLSSCYRLSDAGGYRQAAKTLTEQMQGQGYTVNEREDIEGTGRQVFEVVMPNQPHDIYFLNVFSDEVGSAVYVMTMEMLTLRELQQLRA